MPNVLLDPPDREAISGCGTGSFVAVDFETATSERASACAVAAVVVDDGQIVEQRTWLIKPPNNAYDDFNMMLHGIGPSQTADAPGFAELIPQLLACVDDRPVIAHYLPFDLGVLRACHAAADLTLPTWTVGCTVTLSRRCWPGLPSYSLPVVAEYLDIDLSRHHDPLADALACAHIAQAVLVATDAPDLEHASSVLGVSLGRLWPGNYEPCRADSISSSSSIRDSLVAPNPADLDPDHPFARTVVAFTGALLSMPRRQGGAASRERRRRVLQHRLWQDELPCLRPAGVREVRRWAIFDQDEEGSEPRRSWVAFADHRRSGVSPDALDV